jgi:selenium metabolism protein YedF
MSNPIIVDVRGCECPKPIVETKKILDALEEGEMLVLVDRPTARDNVSRLATNKGCKVEIEEKEGIFNIKIIKIREEPCAFNMTNLLPPGNTVVYVNNDTIGVEKELGKILIESFFKTLMDATPLPAKIIFLSSGALIPTRNEKIIKMLKYMEEKGVDILTCGTCLEYYKLQEELKAGIITNMFDIVDSLNKATKVIKP